MARTLFQERVEATPYESLPANWSLSDPKGFSRQKQLWDCRQHAVAAALAAYIQLSTRIQEVV